MLNAYCTFKLFLKVCLVQGPNTILQSALLAFERVCSLSFLCVSDVQSVDASNLVVGSN